MKTLLAKPAQVYAWLTSMRRRLATVGVGVLACMLGIHVLFGTNGFVSYMQKRSEYQELQKELDGLKHENERISEQIKDLRTDPQSIEKEAREQLRYARPGEVVLIAPESRPSQQQASAPAKK